MKKSLFVFAFAILVGGSLGSSVFADDNNLVRFKGGIGAIPVSNVVVDATTTPPTVTVNRNIVRGVNPAGQIWVIRDLDARVSTSGEIRVRGKGLILGGGNNAGRATGQSVFATLICEAAATFIERSSTLTGVPLAANGDFEINDVLSPFPAGGCDSPMLLIRTANAIAANRTWFAVGIPRLAD